jgi:hypothetical protein
LDKFQILHTFSIKNPVMEFKCGYFMNFLGTSPIFIKYWKTLKLFLEIVFTMEFLVGLWSIESFGVQFKFEFELFENVVVLVLGPGPWGSPPWFSIHRQLTRSLTLVSLSAGWRNQTQAGPGRPTYPTCRPDRIHVHGATAPPPENGEPSPRGPPPLPCAFDQ